MPRANQVQDIIEGLNRLRTLAFDIPSEEGGRPFTPRSALQRHLSRARIRSLLELRKPSHIALDVLCDQNTIWNNYLSVLGTLIRIDKYEYIRYFIADNLLMDDKLPFRECNSLPVECRFFFDEFFSAQWEFCPQELRSGRLDDIRILKDRILPITSRKLLKEGCDAKVEVIEIYEDYNSLDIHGKPCANKFVVKSYPNESLYYNEVKAYKMLSHNDIAANLVHYFGCWVQDGRYNILLEYVDGGTLTDVFNGAHPTSKVDRLRFWRQLLQVANPICRIHSHTDPEDSQKVIVGIHQDIKPANILRSASMVPGDYSDSIYKLVDLGLTFFDTNSNPKAKSKILDGRGTQMFSAPECYRDEQDLFHGRQPQSADPSKDVWSLGCVFSLALVWSVLGPKKAVEYQNHLVAATEDIPEMRESAYSGCFHDGVKVLQVVLDMHIEVLKERGVDQVIPELVAIIEDMLDVAESRPDIFKVRERCNKALKRVVNLLNTDESAFYHRSQSFLKFSQPPQTPQEVPPICELPHSGLGLGGIPFAQSPSSIGPVVDSGQSSPTSPSAFRSQVSTHEPMDNIFPGRLSSTGYPNAHNQHQDVTSHESSVLPAATTGPRDQGSATHPSNFLEFITSNPVGQRHFQADQANKDRSVYHYYSPTDEVAPPSPIQINRTVNGHTTQPTVQAQRCSRPCASIDQVYTWIKKKKQKKKKKITGIPPPCPILETEVDSLTGRDQIFLIDNSFSMKTHRKEVRRTLESLGYLVKHFYPDGIEICFTKTSKSARHKDREKLLKLFDNVTFNGDGGMQRTLGKILDQCTEKKPKSSILHRKKGNWGVSIYVLTDGVWGHDDKSTLCGIPEIIKTTVKKLDSNVKLGIQFIRFGDDPNGIWRLRELDDEWKKHGVDMDIIDTTPNTGNVLKMLLGSFDRDWDNDNEPSTPSAQSTSDTRYAATQHSAILT